MTIKPSNKATLETSTWLKHKLVEQYNPVLLDWNVFLKQAKEDVNRSKTIDKILTAPSTAFTVLNGVLDSQRIHTDDYALEFNKRWIERLRTDHYIEEAFQIATDYIEWRRKNKLPK